MKWITIIALLFLMVPSSSLAAEGLVSVKSRFGVEKTMKRYERVLKKKGMKIIARINHGAAAKSAGIDLRKMQLVIFGNPKVGSPLMKCQPTVAIDLPQKAVVYEDAAGSVWLAYNNPAWLKARHDIEGCDEVLSKITVALHNFAEAATH